MATLTVQSITRSGLTPSFASAAGGGDQFANGGFEYAEFVNGSGGTITISATIQKTVDGNTPTAKQITVGAGARGKFGPFPPEFYNDTNGMVQLTYSGVSSLTVGVFRLQ